MSRLRSLIKSSGPKTPIAAAPENESNEPRVPSLKVKRVDYYYSRWNRTWKYRNMSSNIKVETLPAMQSGSHDAWKDFAFVIVRTIPKEEDDEPSFKVVIKSEYVLKICQDVIQSWPGISWNADPLELDVDIIITFLDDFEEYRDKLSAKESRSDLDSHLLQSVDLLISTFKSDFAVTLSTLRKFKTHGEINFHFLQYLLVPRTLFVTTCSKTGKIRLLKLLHSEKICQMGGLVYSLTCECIDLVDADRPGGGSTVRVAKVQTTIYLCPFRGTISIQDLDAYPLKFHPDAEGIRLSLLKRGKKWLEMIGTHHKQYKGIAVLSYGATVIKHDVSSRIMVDRAMFRKINPNYKFPAASNSSSSPRRHRSSLVSESDQAANQGNGILIQNQQREEAPGTDISDDEIILASTTVYGFSLGDKIWLEFDIDNVKDVEWNDDAFKNLVLPASRKNLLQSLVESHHRGMGFDDFIKGKGHGLVVNLFGPPGVGKTFSAEATSEHVRRPLYVVGGGDLGTTASQLDKELERIFNIATAWKAIVLIDEADVFLERRSLHELERNAMVAVFLRHVEYYRGILFLTTNRIQAFDEAFLSRIHVALHFKELDIDSRKQVWTAFISKLGISHSITPEQISELASCNINGRQIKNAARTAHSLAIGRGERVGVSHFMETLNAMEEFNREFREVNGTC